MAKKSQKNKSESENFDDTALDNITDVIDQVFHEEISSGKLFDIPIENYTSHMNMNMLFKFFEQVESYSMIDLVIDYKLDKAKINDWFKSYKNFKLKAVGWNKQFTTMNTTKEQVILYFYLLELGIINEEKMLEYFPNGKAQSILISFLLGKDESNTRKHLREVNTLSNGRSTYNAESLNKILQIANTTKCKELIKLVERDLMKRVKKED